MGTQLFVVISDPHIARDLMVAHGAIFSSWKQYFMKNQVILYGWAITASEYGDKWWVVLVADSCKASLIWFLCRRWHCQLAMQVLTPKAMQGFISIMEYESHILIKLLYEEGQKGIIPINPAHYAGCFALKSAQFTFSGMLFRLTEHTVTCLSSHLACGLIRLVTHSLKKLWNSQWSSWI